VKLNERDTSQRAFALDKSATHQFEQAVLATDGIEFRYSTDEEDIYHHIDYRLEFNNKIHSVDLKAQKRLRRNDSHLDTEYVWIEFKGITGHAGWLYGDADYIVFEREDSFVFILRTDVINFCNRYVDTESFVTKPTECHYNIYQRFGREDELTRIEFEKLRKFSKDRLKLKKI